MASSVKNAASSTAPMLSDHAAQNLRTTSIGLSIWLLLWSSFGDGQGCAASRRAPEKCPGSNCNSCENARSARLPADLGGEHRDLHPHPFSNAQRRQHVVIRQRHATIGEELAIHLVPQAQLDPDIGQPRPLLVPVEPSAGGLRRAG